jgi:hypothetical protein
MLEYAGRVQGDRREDEPIPADGFDDRNVCQRDNQESADHSCYAKF